MKNSSLIFKTKELLGTLLVCLSILLSGEAVAQMPNSSPKPGGGGVVKLHGQPYLVVSLPVGTPYQLGSCIPGKPVLTFTVQVSNQGTLANRAKPPETAVALDDSVFPVRWQGETSLPEIPVAQSVRINIPVMYTANMDISGTHVFRLYVPGDAGKDPTTQNPQSASSRVVFPDGYCAPPNSRPKPQQSAPQSSLSPSALATVQTIAPQTGESSSQSVSTTLRTVGPGQQPMLSKIHFTNSSVAVVNANLCAIEGNCPPPKPVVTSMLPFSNITPGGGVIVQGQNFASADGSFGQFQLILNSGATYSLQSMQWGDTFAAGTIPDYWGAQLDTGAILRIVRSDGEISNPLPVSFTATRDFAVLPPTDIQITCSQGADANWCPRPENNSSASAEHNTGYGHDMGVDQFDAALQNGWVFYQMNFSQLSNLGGTAQAPSGFSMFAKEAHLKIYWDEDGGPLLGAHEAITAYDINLYIVGPKGTPWNRPMY